MQVYGFLANDIMIESRQSTVLALGTVVDGMNLSKKSGRLWGVCDFITISGIEFCMMFFRQMAICPQYAATYSTL